MRKLINGIVDFQKNKRSSYRQKYAKLSAAQSPDALLIACCDSRVVPNIFASTDPGDLFVVRNIGNLVPPYAADNSMSSVLEYALNCLEVSDIIVCGHSECGAMQTLLDNNVNPKLVACKNWLEHAQPAYETFHKLPQQQISEPENLSPSNILSRINVLTQLKHLKTYPDVCKKLRDNQIRIHGLWFDLTTANVFYYDSIEHKFILINEENAEKILTSLT